jgi:Transposase IS4
LRAQGSSSSYSDSDTSGQVPAALGKGAGGARGARAAPAAALAPWRSLAAGADCGAPRQPFTGNKAGARSDKAKLPYTAGVLAFFRLFVTQQMVARVARFSNMYAAQHCTEKENFQMFKAAEVDKFIGLLLRLGLQPVHDVLSWWSDPEKSFCFGDARVPLVMTARRFKQLRAYLHLSDPSNTKDKFGDFEKDLLANCEANWIPGEHLSVDEQTVGCTARSSKMTVIKYKKEGDGYQCDAVNDRQYTVSWRWRWQPPPPGPAGVSPTGCRVLALLKVIGGHYRHVYSDNLYISEKLLRLAVAEKVYMAGTCRKGGRGFPVLAAQKELTSKAAISAAQGTIKAAVSRDGALLAVSVYDKKPVQLLSTIHTRAVMVAKTRQVWDSKAGHRVPLPFQRLNVVDDYNFKMNSTDMADQARTLFRPDRFLRFRKWWFSIFIWQIGIAVTNAYVCYTDACAAASVKPMEHKAFRERLADLLCHPEDADPAPSPPSRKRAKRLSSDWEEKFPERKLGRHPLEVFEKSTTDCQLCKVEQGKSVAAKLACRACGVNLCKHGCWNTWHGLE